MKPREMFMPFIRIAGLVGILVLVVVFVQKQRDTGKPIAPMLPPVVPVESVEPQPAPRPVEPITTPPPPLEMPRVEETVEAAFVPVSDDDLERRLDALEHEIRALDEVLRDVESIGAD